MTTVTTAQSRKMQVIKGDYAPTEAKELLGNLLDSQINHQKIQHWINWEANHNQPDQHQHKLAELTACKERFEKVIKEASELGCRLQIEGNFELKLTQ